MKKNLMTALRAKLLGQKAVVIAEIDLMLDSPRVIPEHTNFMAELESKFMALAEITDKLEAIASYESSYMRDHEA
jgi:hypothetical protein